MRLLFSISMALMISTYLTTVHAMGDPVAGKAKAILCDSCHGVNSKNPLAPKLAGQPHNYSFQQLTKFKDGTRKDPIMNGMAAAKTEQDMQDIAAYYASLPYQKVNRNELSTISMHGENLYKQKCVMCHGELGNGSKSNKTNSMFGSRLPQANSHIPLIGGQPQLYLVKAMKQYRAKQRQTNGKDYMMDMVMEYLSDDQINVIANYLSSLSGSVTTDESLAKND